MEVGALDRHLVSAAILQPAMLGRRPSPVMSGSRATCALQVACSTSRCAPTSHGNAHPMCSFLAPRTLGLSSAANGSMDCSWRCCGSTTSSHFWEGSSSRRCPRARS